MEEQKQYKEGILILAQHRQKFRALQLASKYVNHKCVSLSEVDEFIIKYGKEQVQILSGRGFKEKDRLVTIIDILPPALQVQYLEQGEAYNKAFEVLMKLGKEENAYELALNHALYEEAYVLAKQKEDTAEQHRVVLNAAKFKATSPHVKMTINLEMELEGICYCENVSPPVKGIASLYRGKLSGDTSWYNQALKLFKKGKYTLGECETLVLLMPKVHKNMELVEMMVDTCIRVDKLCRDLEKRHTASFSYAIEQVVEFYGFVKERNGYFFHMHQDVWKIIEDWQEGNPTVSHLNVQQLCTHIVAHLSSNVKKLMGNAECWEIVQGQMTQFEFHHKCAETPIDWHEKSLLKCIKTYSLSLEILSHNEECLEELQEWLGNFIKYNGQVMNGKHFDVMRRFPSVLNSLNDMLQPLLKAKVHHLTLSDWMKMWILSQALNKGDHAMTQQTKPTPIYKLGVSEVHFFVSVRTERADHKVPHFRNWIRFCQLLREGSKARIAGKVLMSYLETIARRRSINESIICISNTVTMLNMSLMIFYAFHTLCHPQQVVIFLPQILVDMVTNFDQKNCQKEQHFKLFQSCFNTFKIMATHPHIIASLRYEVENGIKRILKVLTGLYNNRFNVLDRAVTNEAHNDIVTCLTLALTLLGNLATSTHCRPPDLLVYQQRIENTLQHITKQPDHHLRGICNKFQYCSSTKDIFYIIVKISQHFYRDRTGSNHLLKLQTLDQGFNLMPVTLESVPQKPLLPIKVSDVATRAEDVKYRYSDTDLPENLSSVLATESESESERETEIERQTSNEENNDEDVMMELGMESKDQMERQVSVDKAIVDEGFCVACKTQLVDMSKVENFNSPLRQHIESEYHKQKEKEYNIFAKTEKSLSDEVQTWKKGIEALSSSEIVITEVLECIDQIERTICKYRKCGDWKEGEKMFQILQEKSSLISKLLNDAIEKEKTSDTDDVEDKADIWPTKPEEQIDEEVLSGMEDDQTPPGQRKKGDKRRRKKHNVTL